METALEKSTDRGPQLQPAPASARCATPMTVSTAALRIGLAHFIHEINNPVQLLHFAVGFMEVNMAKANGCGASYTDHVYQQLKGGVDELVSLISSLQSQLKSLWMIDPVVEAVNLASLIDDICQSDAARFAAGRIRVDKDIPVKLPAIQGDEKLLRQVFVNLCRNAADAMAQGGVLSIRAGARERSVWLEVADTGAGIPPDLDVFQPFTTSKPGGMGLGLAIARHIVETHGGTIAYSSQLGKGTTFCLSFPRLIEAKQISAWRAPAEDQHSDRISGNLGRAANK